MEMDKLTETTEGILKKLKDQALNEAIGSLSIMERTNGLTKGVYETLDKYLESVEDKVRLNPTLTLSEYVDKEELPVGGRSARIKEMVKKSFRKGTPLDMAERAVKEVSKRYELKGTRHKTKLRVFGKLSDAEISIYLGNYNKSISKQYFDFFDGRVKDIVKQSIVFSNEANGIADILHRSLEYIPVREPIGLVMDGDLDGPLYNSILPDPGINGFIEEDSPVLSSVDKSSRLLGVNLSKRVGTENVNLGRSLSGLVGSISTGIPVPVLDAVTSVYTSGTIPVPSTEPMERISANKRTMELDTGYQYRDSDLLSNIRTVREMLSKVTDSVIDRSKLIKRAGADIRSSNTHYEEVMDKGTVDGKVFFISSRGIQEYLLTNGSRQLTLMTRLLTTHGIGAVGAIDSLHNGYRYSITLNKLAAEFTTALIKDTKDKS